MTTIDLGECEYTGTFEKGEKADHDYPGSADSIQDIVVTLAGVDVTEKMTPEQLAYVERQLLEDHYMKELDEEGAFDE